MLATATPSWYSGLASDAKSYVLNAAAVEQSVYPQIKSLDSILGIAVNPTPVVSITSVSGSMTTEAVSSSSGGFPPLFPVSSGQTRGN